MVHALIQASDERNEYLSEMGSSENTHLMEALAIIAGGGRTPEKLKVGFERLGKLKEVMNEHRVQRLLSIGLDLETAEKISLAHTPNFM